MSNIGANLPVAMGATAPREIGLIAVAQPEELAPTAIGSHSLLSF